MDMRRAPATQGQIKTYQRYIELLAGTVIGVAGFQVFTVPLGFYNGGTVGAGADPAHAAGGPAGAGALLRHRGRIQPGVQYPLDAAGLPQA